MGKLPGAVGSAMRSRRLAVWLLVLVGAWSVVGTLVPQGALDSTAAEQWAQAHPALEVVVGFVGLHHAFRAPVFLLLLTFLTTSTLLCAWERTGAVQRMLQRTNAATVPRDTVIEHAHVSVEVYPALDVGAAEEAVRSAIRRMRLRVSSADGVIEGGKARWSAVGSPIFHWALALLIIVISLGQLTRAEGLMGVPEGDILPDVAESYGALDTGPWFSGLSEYGIGISEFKRSFNDGTVDRGASPVVTLWEGETELVSQRVYPNQPLRYGDMMIHMNNWGYAPEVGFTTAGGDDRGSLKLIVDVEEGIPRSTSSGFEVTSSADGEVLVFEATLISREGGPEMEVTALASDGSRGESAQLGLGEVLTLPSGDRIEYRALDYYARLSVVHDWSITPIYTLFIIGLIGVSVAVLDPYRRVAVVVSGRPDAHDILDAHVLIRRGRRSALFVDRVKETLEAAVGAVDESESNERKLS
ncbi:MAG: cytochrome c biogenesis protein ResB [Actinomycetota bacterium]|jgi:hypothetical protein|nr:cytochrome c biogenesis protein ResB [Actinomycetota bacterium]